ncbi:NupC/NupG family nucleoside CNT transporter [Sphingomonas changnyeongensis]|uniref:NupC/NupG family nucleoside CNT transporter n=1 Tax=Sphingomonas changnyeongensis TaxID=2698679 RepID=A0A7Z2NVP1_9SPHN|nr:nucleoside transporter C-terminal domain-containing protein [Sphingomonas changnyeongensis]QHL90326.1 NupC/NupG family nucleoside CNT transporter [Sphingomonas changnyeongensis]
MSRLLIGLAGIIVILGLAVLLSANRRAIRPRVVGSAFALQAGIAVLVLYVPAGRAVIEALSRGVSNLLGYASDGTRLLFGNLASDPKFGTAFAISGLPVIIFFAALIAVLYHLRVMPFVIRWVGGAIERLTGVSKVESLCAAANIFVGQSESPLVIRPYLAALTPSQLFAVMSVGMAGVAGTILAAYASFLGPESLPYLLAASFMAAPGGLLMAKIVMPDERGTAAPVAVEDEVIAAVEAHEEEEKAANIIMAAAMGAQTGVRIAVAVGAMVLAFVALVALANGILGGIGGWFGYPGLSFQGVLGTLLAPLMVLINIPWAEAQAAGGLLGTKIVLNEFVAFIDLGQATVFSDRSRAIITFVLCGFANFSSIAIQMAATGSLAPNQRPLIAQLGVRAVIAGTLANLMSAALAGILLP